jgi:diguanylate cyclase (GGDEF)-like protein
MHIFKRLPKWVLYIWGGYSGLALLITLIVVFLIKEPSIKTNITNISLPIWNFVTTAVLLIAALRSVENSRRVALAWAFLGFAHFLYTTGDIIWSILEANSHQPPFPSAADVFYFGFYPAFLAGILILPMKQLSTRERWKVVIDISIVMLAALLLFWNYLLGPLFTADFSGQLLAGVLTVAYPVGDIVLFAALLILLFRQPQEQETEPLLFLIAGVFLLIVSDAFYGYQSILGTYTSGSTADLGWTAAYLLIMTAGVLQVYSQKPETSQQHVFSDTRSDYGISRWAMYFPYGWVIAGYLVLDQSHYNEMPLNPASIVKIIGVIISLVVVRQVITLNENYDLFRELKSALQKVRMQSLELRSTNRELETEISERRRAEEMLAYEALHDPLTGLPNRALFLDRLRTAIENGTSRTGFCFAVLFLDIDQFKGVNDSLGHSAGDLLLIQIAERLKSCLRASDTVARLGGDEFVILLENSGDHRDVIRTANRIQEQIQMPVILSGDTVFVSASIGIVMDICGYNKSEEVLRDADLAMYHAKAQGKARYEIFMNELRQQALVRHELEYDLRFALARGELFIDYQPIVSLASGRITGFEALLRWNHPTRGLIGPRDFIPIAEETGLIIPIGIWVLREACAQMREWQKKYPGTAGMTVSVNISGVQLAQVDVVETISGLLLETGLPGKALHLEVSESTCMKRSQTVIEAIRSLSKIGIAFQVDNFGIGYSPLSYLRDYPIQGIKIGQPFINNIADEQKSGIIRTMVALAHTMGIEAIAEGIETEEQLQSLKALGCSSGQGYIISHPVDQVDVSKMLSSRNE